MSKNASWGGYEKWLRTVDDPNTGEARWMNTIGPFATRAALGLTRDLAKEDWWKDPGAWNWSGNPAGNEFASYWDNLNERQQNYLSYIPDYVSVLRSSPGETTVPADSTVPEGTGEFDPFLDVDTSGRDAAWEAIQRLLTMTFPSFADWMSNQEGNFQSILNSQLGGRTRRRRPGGGYYAPDEGNPFTSDILGTGAYTGLQGLTDVLTNPPSEEDLSAQGDYMNRIRAQARGMGDEEYTAWLEEQQDLTEEDMAGMGEEERVARQRMMRSIQGEQEERMTRAMSVHMAGRGTLGQGFAQLDQMNQQIRDTRLQSELALITDDSMRATEQFNRHTQEMLIEHEAGRLTAQQFMENLRDNRMGALQGYATQITTMVQQNSQYLQMYQIEMDNIKAQIEKEYQIIMGGIGISEFDLNAVIEEFNAELGTKELDFLKDELANAEPTDTESLLDNLWKGLAVIGSILGPIAASLDWGEILGNIGGGGKEKEPENPPAEGGNYEYGLA